MALDSAERLEECLNREVGPDVSLEAPLDRGNELCLEQVFLVMELP